MQQHQPFYTGDCQQDDSGSMEDNDSFCCEPRGRCYTWPIPLPQLNGPVENGSVQPCQPSCSSQLPSLASLSPTPIGQSQHNFLSGSQQLPHHFLQSTADSSGEAPPKSKPKRIRRRTDGSGAIAGSGKKPNPWGEESYSDLIARALCNAMDGRLKLNEIYQWFSDNIPYFAARSSQEEAQGWKVGEIGHKWGKFK